MKKIEKTDNQIVFVSEMNETLANAIRRYMLHVPVMAIDTVEISRNDSPLYDETIAHRLGLIPLETEGSVNEKSEGKFKLDISKEGTVYSGDLKGKPNIIYKKIPLTTLSKGQELQLIALAKAGMGIEHAKFSPGVMFYRNVSEIIIDKELADKVKAACPESHIKEKGNKIVITDNGKKEISDVCEGIAHKARKNAEINTTGEIVITLESFGQMSSGDVFRKSIGVLKKDINAFQKAIDKAA